MSTQHYEFTCGDTPTITETITDNGAAFDLTGYSITFVLRDDGPTGTVKLTKTDADYITVTDAANGEFVVSFIAADTATLSPGTYWYGCTITAGASNYTVAEGFISLLADGV